MLLVESVVPAALVLLKNPPPSSRPSSTYFRHRHPQHPPPRRPPRSTITYDKYYQTPRVWLFGYNEDGAPLTKAQAPPRPSPRRTPSALAIEGGRGQGPGGEQIFEDIYADYSNKTTSIEAAPAQTPRSPPKDSF